MTSVQQVQAQMLRCQQGDHNLVPVLAFGDEYEDKVVRWCSFCGSVVVDVEVDGRLVGHSVPMARPDYLLVSTLKDEFKKKETPK